MPPDKSKRRKASMGDAHAEETKPNENMTTTHTHTSGPWIRKGDWIHGTPESGASRGIAQILGNCGCTETTEANARLITAAPELLEALRVIYANAAESPEWIRARIGPAIAKAEGGEA